MGIVFEPLLPYVFRRNHRDRHKRRVRGTLRFYAPGSITISNEKETLFAGDWLDIVQWIPADAGPTSYIGWYAGVLYPGFANTLGLGDGSNSFDAYGEFFWEDRANSTGGQSWFMYIYATADRTYMTMADRALAAEADTREPATFGVMAAGLVLVFLLQRRCCARDQI